MKTLTCYTAGRIHDETLDALAAFAAPSMEIALVQLRERDSLAYGRTIRTFWRAKEDLFIVEPDIVIRQDVVDAVWHCGCEYGCFPYAWLTDVGPALGCTWFKESFIRKYIHALDEIADHIGWQQFDCVFMRHILAREHGQQPHVHLPPVEHLNPEKQLLPDANPEPLMSVPLW